MTTAGELWVKTAVIAVYRCAYAEYEMHNVIDAINERTAHKGNDGRLHSLNPYIECVNVLAKCGEISKEEKMSLIRRFNERLLDSFGSGFLKHEGELLAANFPVLPAWNSTSDEIRYAVRNYVEQWDSKHVHVSSAEKVCASCGGRKC